MDMKERAQELTIAISKRATSGGTFDFQAAYALILDALEGLAQAQRERDAMIAHGRAVEWDAVKAAHPDDDATMLAAAHARWLEACDIAARILAQS